MSKDLLAEATRALRETAEASEFEARATRTRVMTGLHQSRVKRRTRLAFLLPIAATFVAASAWGAVSGKARLVFENIEHWVGVSANAPAAPAAPKRAAVSAAASAIAPLEAPPPALEPAAVEQAPEPAAAVVTVPNAAHGAPSALASAPRAEASDPALELYRAAHNAHFVDHDPARALAAWDAYLAAAPNGQLAPEARYNRALSLVRLGRFTDARTALAPFASGAYGGYRKAEASALLERLSE